MLKAPNPKDEKERLRALKELDVLDTISEKEYDRLTVMAANISGCKIALISLVDSDRQWFKSKYGLDISETPRDISFCGHAINDNAQFVIEDATKDERFADNPLVIGPPHVVFYAGTPLIRSNGYRIGTLCVIDNHPRKISREQLEQLKILADTIIDLLESRAAALHLNLQNHYSDLYQKISNIGGWSFQLKSGKITWSNQMFELFPEDIEKGEPSYDQHKSTIHPEDQVHWEQTVNTCIDNGKPYVMRFRVKTKEDPNKYKWIEANGEGVYGDNGELEMLMGTCQDISYQIELEQQKQINMQQAKLASLGQMAAGVAHEINNPLAIISGSVELLNKDKITNERIVNVKSKVKKSVDRIKLIVDGLRKFSRQDTQIVKRVVRISSIFNDLKVLTQPRLRQKTTKISIESDDNRIECNQMQIEQVLVNLVHNAIDAVHNQPNSWIKVFTKEDEENNLSIIVQDSGTGISEDILEKIFDPFFTTKDVNQGTGLGLSISISITESNGGILKYELIDGHTAFVLKFKKISISVKTEAS